MNTTTRLPLAPTRSLRRQSFIASVDPDAVTREAVRSAPSSQMQRSNSKAHRSQFLKLGAGAWRPHHDISKPTYVA